MVDPTTITIRDIFRSGVHDQKLCSRKKVHFTNFYFCGASSGEQIIYLDFCLSKVASRQIGLAQTELDP
jgi:hypothetical protein